MLPSHLMYLTKFHTLNTELAVGARLRPDHLTPLYEFHPASVQGQRHSIEHVTQTRFSVFLPTFRLVPFID